MQWLNSIVPTLIGLIGAAIGWFLKSKFEAKKRAEEALRDERATIYVDILIPFAQLFTDLSAKNQQDTLKQIVSLDYRKKSFRLILVGADDVIQAWNHMWDTVYKVESGEDPRKILLSFGDVLLAIRRGLGNTNTLMKSKDMLRWLIKDIDSLN